MVETIITVRNLTKVYGSLKAVDDISFGVHEGETFGLLGPNGAGKTTTMEIMETLREPTSGEVIVDGNSIHSQKDTIKQIIGVQLQQSGFYPNLKLSELLKLFGGLYNVDADVSRMLELVGLREKAHSFYSKLSGGQKQRFSLATTLINTPKIVFLDEPSTGLDPQARIKLWDLIRGVRERGTTVVVTTHYMDEAEKLCDRVGIMDLGKIIAIDTPDNLINALVRKGFKRRVAIKEATLEDVFLNLTGHELRDE